MTAVGHVGYLTPTLWQHMHNLRLPYMAAQTQCLPALLTSTSTAPHLSVTVLKRASSSSLLATLQPTVMASPPSFAISAATSSALSGLEA